MAGDYRESSGIQIIRAPEFNNPRFIASTGEALKFTASRAFLRQVRTAFLNEPETKDDEPRKYSKMFGTPVFDYLSIYGGEYRDINGERYQYAGGAGNEFHIENVIMEIRRQKKMVKNSMNGREGTQKDFINAGDYQVNVNGLLAGEGNKYPREEVEILQTILNANTPLEVESEFLGQFLDEDYYLVVEDYRISQKRGFRNIQPFSINFVSDKPINLQELNIESENFKSNLFFA